MTLAGTLGEAWKGAARLEGQAVLMAAALSAAHFDVSADHVLTGIKDNTSDYGQRASRARDCAIWLVHAGLGWPQKTAGTPFGMSEHGVYKALRRVSDAEDEQLSVTEFIARCEALLANEAG